MATSRISVKKEFLLNNALMAAIAHAQIDTLYGRIAREQRAAEFVVDASDESAMGRFNKKGAIFIPNGFIYPRLVTNRGASSRTGQPAIHSATYNSDSESSFQETVLDSLKYDGATFIGSQMLLIGALINNGFFSDKAPHFYNRRRGAKRRTSVRNFPVHLPPILDISTSYTPPGRVFGGRGYISAWLATAFVNPVLYHDAVVEQFWLTDEDGRHDATDFLAQIIASFEPLKDSRGRVYRQPCIVTCHVERDGDLTGLTSILGYGKFGEFATITIEYANPDILSKLVGSRTNFQPRDIIAEQIDHKYIMVLRVYPSTVPGKRPRPATYLVDPIADMGLDLEAITESCRTYHKVARQATPQPS